MKSSGITSPVYAQIALDIALRIARGELKEKSRVYGRSVMSSEYGVSPETIRRSLRLLEDMNIVAVKQNSGCTVLSAANARKYVEHFGKQNSIRAMQKKLKELLAQQQDVNRKIVEASGAIVRLNERRSRSNPFLNYEVTVDPTSPVVGKTLSDLKFWQETAATVIAIRREDKLILSPGPYATLEEQDTIVYVGDLNCMEAVNKLVSG